MVFANQQGLYARVNVLTYFMGRVHFVGGHDVWWVDDQNIVKSGNAKLDFLYNLHTEVLMSANESRHRRRNPPSATVPCRIPVRCQPSDLFPVVAEGRSQPSAIFFFPFCRQGLGIFTFFTFRLVFAATIWASQSLAYIVATDVTSLQPSVVASGFVSDNWRQHTMNGGKLKIAIRS